MNEALQVYVVETTITILFICMVVVIGFVWTVMWYDIALALGRGSKILCTFLYFAGTFSPVWAYILYAFYQQFFK